ncbi:tRNA (N6-threonylcarbamoyladenosine(37)-N6)-methyltransferase TrmO [bacterium]|nr:tRNA (N6-threonylcarbamoyladenosine(37)-N6)-methyltransferase TrmO [bacterium]
MEIHPIAFVQSPRGEIEDDNWGNVESVIELIPKIKAEAFDGIDQFSHLEIIYYFHRVKPEKIVTDSRHPRNNKDWPKCGIFAQRGKNRPNCIGLTIVRLLQRKGKTIVVLGLDAVDGTPVLDIKPVMKEFLPREDVIQPSWSSELMNNYW